MTIDMRFRDSCSDTQDQLRVRVWRLRYALKRIVHNSQHNHTSVPGPCVKCDAVLALETDRGLSGAEE